MVVQENFVKFRGKHPVMASFLPWPATLLKKEDAIAGVCRGTLQNILEQFF